MSKPTVFEAVQSLILKHCGSCEANDANPEHKGDCTDCPVSKAVEAQK